MIDAETVAERIDAIVLGASAGGVDALSTLLPALPASTRVAVLVVVHLPRERPSVLADIFGPKCSVRVKEADDKEPVQGGTVYFAPPDYHLLVDQGPSVALSVDAPVEYCRPSVDVLFESAADVYRDRLMGVVLTGANADGSAGLAYVKRAGGITVVQSPETAYAATMPRSALRGADVNLVLTLEQLASLLRGLG